jgi:hypothetical protein
MSSVLAVREISTESEGGLLSNQFKVNTDPKSSIYAHIALVGVGSVPAGMGGADCYISEWVKDQHAYLNQTARVLTGTGYSELTFKLDANTGRGRAIGVVEVF